MNSYTLGGSLLTIQDLSLSFGDNLILRNISFEIRDIIGYGQVCTLVGRSGCGKSQLFKTIAGLQKPTSGDVFLGEGRRKVETGMVGMVAQNYPLFMHRTVGSNLEMVCKDREKIYYYMSEFDLLEHMGKFPKQLSGGQRQRVAIVQQILCSEHFILLDEPFASLDAYSIAKTCDIIQKVAHMDELNTVIIASHILEPSLAISDRAIVLGHEYDAEGKKIPGAIIKKDIDLASQGLAWRKDIETDPKFVSLCKEVKEAIIKV